MAAQGVQTKAISYNMLRSKQRIAFAKENISNMQANLKCRIAITLTQKRKRKILENLKQNRTK